MRSTMMKNAAGALRFPGVLVLLFGVFASFAAAEGPSVLKGKVVDGGGRAVEGARVFVYDSPDVRRSATYISASTDRDGLFRVVLKPGKYWSLARLKKTEGYGPLMAGDKHSGDPAEIELSDGQELTWDFTVVDLKEARNVKTREQAGPVKISGRIIDEKGSPVTKSYAIANGIEKLDGMPDYLSAWVDKEGHYTLYLPRGKYFIGGALTFPPGQNYFVQKEMTVDVDISGMDIIKKTREQ
jgi:hypothetical protein